MCISTVLRGELDHNGCKRARLIFHIGLEHRFFCIFFGEPVDILQGDTLLVRRRELVKVWSAKMALNLQAIEICTGTDERRMLT